MSSGMSRKDKWINAGVYALGLVVVSTTWFFVGILRVLLGVGSPPWTSDFVEIEISAAWASLNLVGFVLPRRRKSWLPDLSASNLVLVGIEVATVAAAFTTGRVLSRKYSALAGGFLLIIGWLLANRRLISRSWRRRASRNVVRRGILQLARSLVRLFPSPRRVSRTRLIGEGVQLLGLAVLWWSPYALLTALLFFPVLLVKNYADAKQEPQPPWSRILTEPKRWFRNSVWSVLGVLLRVGFVAGLPLLLAAICTRDIPLFFGDVSEAVRLMETLIQVEVTVFVLGLSLLFVLVELTTATYSPRLVGLLFQRKPFRVMLAAAGSSFALKLMVMSNASRWLVLPGAGGPSWVIDLALLLSGLALGTFVLLSRDMYRMMSPEAVVREALRGFDESWMWIIRGEWSSSRGPRSMYIARDPMVRVEAILASALHRRDLNTFRTSLILLREKMEAASGEHDGAINDKYLLYHLANIIDMAAEMELDNALTFLCDVLNEVTMPSSTFLAEADVSSFESPPGGRLLMRVVEEAITHRLPDPAQRSLHYLNERATRTVMAMPDYSDLGFIFGEDREDQPAEDEAEIGWRNDEFVMSYHSGYLTYFGGVGRTAVEAGLAPISWTATHNLCAQASRIAEHIAEETYQMVLVRFVLDSLDGVVSAACREQLAGAIDFAMLQYAVRESDSKGTGTLIARFLAHACVQMANAGILDAMSVINIAMTARHAAEEHNPRALSVIIEAFGEAGAGLRKRPGFAEQDELGFAHQEVIRRIDQLEGYGRRFEIQSNIEQTAQQAREKARGRKRLSDASEGQTTRGTYYAKLCHGQFGLEQSQLRKRRRIR